MSLITDSRLPLYMNFIIVPMANPEGKLVLFIVTFYKRPVKNNHKENGNIYV